MSVINSNKFKLNLLTLSITSSLFLVSSNVLAFDCGTVTNVSGIQNCVGTTVSPDATLIINGGNINHAGSGTVISITGDTANGGKGSLTANDLIINSNPTLPGHGIAVTGDTSELTLTGNNSVNLGASGDTAILLTSNNGAIINIAGTLNVTNSSTASATERDGVEANSSVSGNAEIYHSGTGTIQTINGNGLYSKANGAGGGDAIVKATGGLGLILKATGADGKGIYARTSATNTTGNALVESNATIETNGASGHGIWAQSTGENAEVNSTGSITTTGSVAKGIYATTGGNGYVDVQNGGTVNTATGYGIHAQSDSGRTNIVNQGNIISGDRGVFARSASGDIYIKNTGNITTTQSSADIHNHGIDAAATSATGAANVRVDFDDGIIKVSGTTLGSSPTTSGNSIGIAAWDQGTGNSQLTATINVGANAIVDASEGVGGLQIRTNGTGIINIAEGAEVHGGGIISATVGGTSKQSVGYAINLQGTGSAAANYTVNNAGLVDALSDRLITGGSPSGSVLNVNNTGEMYGMVSLGAENTSFNNLSSGIWNIRNFADTDGDLARDTKGVAISNFGLGNDVVINEAGAIVRLSAVTNDTNPALTANQYITSGTWDISNVGTVHGQLLDLERFEHRGIIDLSENGQAGDMLVISGNSSMTGSSIYEGGTITSGGGQFVSDGGFLILDTVLDSGANANSASDVLVIDGALLGANGATQIVINRVDGLGAVTAGDGIKVVEVLGNADVGSFKLAGSHVVTAGAYEYTLHQGALSNPVNNSLFLRTNASQINPDVGAYLANQTAATGLFMHSLHDRLGEPQFYQDYKSDNRSIPALWLRGAVGHSKNEAVNGALKQSTDDHVIHLGGEIASWGTSAEDRYHLGLMGAYGRSETETKNKVTGTKSNSTVDGYGLGAYLTWYSNEIAPEGWYADTWTMYGWFDNETDSSDKYDSKAWTTSLEVGYAAKLKMLDNYDWMIEPQAQLAYHYYSASGIRDRKGSLTVNNPDADGISTRLGGRTYLRPSSDRAIAQPFFEVNWLYNSADNSMDFNGETMASDMPENRFETKVGVQGEVTKNLQAYSHVGVQFGEDSYSRVEGQIGLRYRF